MCCQHNNFWLLQHNTTQHSTAQHTLNSLRLNTTCLVCIWLKREREEAVLTHINKITRNFALLQLNIFFTNTMHIHIRKYACIVSTCFKKMAWLGLVWSGLLHRYGQWFHFEKHKRQNNNKQQLYS